MTEKDIRSIEASLGVKLPAEYRRIVSAGKPKEFWIGGLFNQPERVIEATRWLRDLLADYGASWHESWVVVSEINGGDAVILDTGSPEAPLLLWNHETNTAEPFEESLTGLGAPLP